MSENTYPYTVEQFEEAYKATGLKPITGRTLPPDEPECGCPQGVLAYHRKGERPPDRGPLDGRTDTYDWARVALGLSVAQFGAFVNGFDGGSEYDLRNARRSFGDTAETNDAFERGLECRKRFLEPEGTTG